MFIWISFILFIITVILVVRDVRQERNARLQIQNTDLNIEALQRRISELEKEKKEESSLDLALKKELYDTAFHIHLYCQLAAKEAETASLKEKHQIILEESRKILDRLQ